MTSSPNTDLKNFGIKTKEPKTKNLIFFVLYISLVMVVYILPSVKLIVPYIPAAVLMLAFFPIAMFKTQKYMNYCVLLIATTILYVFIYFVNGIGGITDSINEIIRSLRFFMPVLWALYALNFCTPKQRRCILIVFFIIAAFILIKTIIALEKDVWISRILAQDKTSDTSEIRAYRMGNVGGFEFSYMMGVVTICLAWAALKCKNIWAKILLIAGTVLCFYYIIQTMYMTLLILASIGTILLFIFNTKNALVKVLLIFGSIVIAFSLPAICKYLSGVFTDSLLSTKFMQFYTAMTGGGTDSLGSRPELMSEAFNRWIKSPIWGGGHVSARTHSFFFSALESTGLLGILMLILCFRSTYKIILSELKSKQTETLLFTIVFMYVVALAVFNPVGYVFEVTIAAFFITPVWSELFSKTALKENKKEKKRDKERRVISDLERRVLKKNVMK